MSNSYRELPYDIFSLLYHLLEALASNGSGLTLRVLAVGMSVAVVSGCMNNPLESPQEGDMSEIVITQVDRGQTFNVRKGNTIQIGLEEKLGTNYQWEMETVDTQIVKFQEMKPPQATDTGFGGSRIRTFVFKAQSPGITQVQLSLRRDWENPEAAVDHFAVTISVHE